MAAEAAGRPIGWPNMAWVIPHPCFLVISLSLSCLLSSSCVLSCLEEKNSLSPMTMLLRLPPAKSSAAALFPLPLFLAADALYCEHPTTGLPGRRRPSVASILAGFAPLPLAGQPSQTSAAPPCLRVPPGGTLGFAGLLVVDGGATWPLLLLHDASITYSSSWSTSP
jgi:hypothetical protein